MFNIEAEVDTSRFEALCDELMRYTNVPRDEVFREEVGRVLSAAIHNTPAATKESIERDSANAAYSSLASDFYTPKRPGRRKSVGRVKYKLSNRYPDVLWSRIQKARLTDVARRVRARGLAKQSFYKIGQMLGLAVEAPNYAKQAKASTGREYNDENTRVTNTAGVIEYDIETSQPTLNAIGGDRALQRAIDGRVQYFINNWARDVFSNMARIAKKYPGITITNG